jgi:hypothetical protein
MRNVPLMDGADVSPTMCGDCQAPGLLPWSRRDSGEESWLRTKNIFTPRRCWRSDWPNATLRARAHARRAREPAGASSIKFVYKPHVMVAYKIPHKLVHRNSLKSVQFSFITLSNFVRSLVRILSPNPRGLSLLGGCHVVTRRHAYSRPFLRCTPSSILQACQGFLQQICGVSRQDYQTTKCGRFCFTSSADKAPQTL